MTPAMSGLHYIGISPPRGGVLSRKEGQKKYEATTMAVKGPVCPSLLRRITRSIEGVPCAAPTGVYLADIRDVRSDDP